MTVALALCVIGICFGVVILYRNNAVLEERLDVVSRISRLCRRDIDNNCEWEWRYDSYNEIPYERMVFQLWKPVDSFYRDHPCLKSDYSTAP